MMNKGKGKSYCDCTEKSRQSFQKPTPKKYLDLVGLGHMSILYHQRY